MERNIKSIVLVVFLIVICFHANAQTTAQKIGGNPTVKNAAALLELEATTGPGSNANALTVLKNGNTGIGAAAAAPHSNLQVAGSFALPIKSITADYTVTDQDYKILIRTTTGSTNITLPDPATCKGRIYVIQNMVDLKSSGFGIIFNYDIEYGQGLTLPANTLDTENGLNGWTSTGGIYYSGSCFTLQSDGTVWTAIKS